MKNANVKLILRFFILSISMFLLGLSTSYAQIGPSPAATNTPNYGIYGSAPTPASTPFTCGTPRYAKIEDFPVTAGDENAFSQILPLNGLKNFNFYYTADGSGFLSGGGYKVTYLNANQTTNCYGLGNIVTYSPDHGHTNGVQVRPFNLGSYTTPRGIHGIILAKIPGGGGATAALENAVASVYFGIHKAKTNGVGYFSIYYSISGADGFLTRAAAYSTHISGVYNNCPYTWDDPLESIWQVSIGSPDDPTYYVQGGESDIGTITLESQVTGCQP